MSIPRLAALPLVVLLASCSAAIQSEIGRKPSDLKGKTRPEIHREFGSPLAVNRSENVRYDLFKVTGAWSDPGDGYGLVAFASLGLWEPVAIPVSILDKAVTSGTTRHLMVFYDHKDIAVSAHLAKPRAEEGD
ncbi:MAG: hypothetical protein EOP83_12945 [Verrucomicrobiaceae bacterium]|nr:MAG: hypothetical protein EOP83_12945 [Verrucomicrobiaceae bacterium]